MSKIKVLIVEHTKEIASLLSEHIAKLFPYHVVGIAPTIADAKMMINHLRPQLVILDNFLPDGTGLKLLKNLRAKDNPVDVLFVTAANNNENVITAVRYGAFDYLIKPFSLDKLSDSLQRYYDFSKSLSNDEQVNQSAVSKIYNTHISRESISRHPKGIDEITLQKILVAFDEGEVYTSESICEKASVSRTTARRYLEYAANLGYLSADIEHGRVGRPQRCYRKKSS